MNILKFKTVIVLVVCFLTLIGIYLVSYSSAEQVGSSPNSGSSSRLFSLYDELDTLGYGSLEEGSWGDWGGYWNKIYSASIWETTLGDAVEEDVFSGVSFYSGSGRDLRTGTFSLTGDAGVGDVLEGKTFYSNSKTRLTGTYVPTTGLDWEKQSLVEMDDAGLADYGETSNWTKTNTSPEVWYDSVTGLYWSASQGGITNSFTLSSCDFFTAVPRGDYDGSDVDCGNAINACANLSLDANGNGVNDTNWYLPSQKEIMQAYVNGIYKKTDVDWAVASNFWTSTEYQNDTTTAWYLRMDYGTTRNAPKTQGFYVRCVLRDL